MMVQPFTLHTFLFATAMQSAASSCIVSRARVFPHVCFAGVTCSTILSCLFVCLFSGPYLRLRYVPGIKIAMGLEVKLRGSYLQLPIPGRKTEYQCAGACGRVLSTSAFSYRARRAGEAGEPAVCWSCGVAAGLVRNIFDAVFAGAIRWGKLVKRARKVPLKLSNVSAIHLPTRYRLALLRTAIQAHRQEYFRQQHLATNRGSGTAGKDGAKKDVDGSGAKAGLGVLSNAPPDVDPQRSGPSSDSYDYRHGKEPQRKGKAQLAIEVAGWLVTDGIIPRPEPQRTDNTKSGDRTSSGEGAFMLEF